MEPPRLSSDLYSPKLPYTPAEPPSVKHTPLADKTRRYPITKENPAQTCLLTTGLQLPPFSLSSAVGDAVLSESDSIPSSALHRRLTKRSTFEPLSDTHMALRTSPSFLNPRRAPHPPSFRQDVAVIREASIVEQGERDSCAATIASTDSYQSSKYNATIADGRLPAFLFPPTTGTSIQTISSTESGLERIGVTLLGYHQSSDGEDWPLTTSCSSLGKGNESLGSLLETMEKYGSFGDDPFQKHASESVVTFVLPSIDSGPINLADSSVSLDELRNSNSRILSMNIRVKSLLRTSFTEVPYSLEQLLQDQEVATPSSRNLVELWQALSMGADQSCPSASQSRGTSQPIAQCDAPHTHPPPFAKLHPLPISENSVPETTEDLSRATLHHRTMSLSDGNQAFLALTESLKSYETFLLFEENFGGTNGIGIAI